MVLAWQLLRFWCLLTPFKSYCFHLFTSIIKNHVYCRKLNYFYKLLCNYSSLFHIKYSIMSRFLQKYLFTFDLTNKFSWPFFLPKVPGNKIQQLKGRLLLRTVIALFSFLLNASHLWQQKFKVLDFCLFSVCSPWS